MSAQEMPFQTEVSRLLEIVAGALYTEKEIFLRELVSNAADACDRLRYAAISAPGLLEGAGDFVIDVSFDAAARRLTVSDNGIGMNREELVRNLGTIAHSGTRAMVEGLGADRPRDMNLIGQFGVGFYAAFMVADRVEARSRHAGEKDAWLWSSDGRGGFSVEEALKETRGTEIVLHLKDEAGEFLLEDRLRSVIKKYSDHIGFPVRLNGVTVNAAAALWSRPKDAVTEAQYAEFYRGVSGGLPGDAPWLTLHWKAEGAFACDNLLFVPSVKPFDLYDPRRQHGVKLYVRRVFVTDALAGLIPPFLRFLRGVVDSEDLPLNISREMLQSSAVVAKMGAAITRKVLSALIDRAEKDPDSFARFWALFGPVVKEGLYDAHAHREQLCRLARFASTAGDGLVGLDEYMSRMKEGQEHIHYLSAPSPEAARNSPQIEAFRARGVEVLFMTDAIDEFWLPMQGEYKGRTFRSVTRGDAGLEKVAGAPAPEGKEDAAGAALENLVAQMKAALGAEVRDVRVSARLVDSPVCLVAPENDVDMNMQRLLKKQAAGDTVPAHILEINAAHPVILRLRALAGNDAQAQAFSDAAWLLLDQARIVEGEPLRNPAAFARRLNAAMEKGLL